jgi:hypothetical protein
MSIASIIQRQVTALLLRLVHAACAAQAQTIACHMQRRPGQGRPPVCRPRRALSVDAAGLPAMLARLKPASRVDLLGGSYWLYAELRNDSLQPHWVIDPNDTLIDMVDIQVYGEDGSIRQMLTGYRQPHSYLLHYGKDIDLQPGQRYHVLIRFSSPYYARTPVFSVQQRPPTSSWWRRKTC